MYEEYFGLNRRPFLAKVSGDDVFVGPQTAQTMAALHRALQVQDAVVLVAGPAGCGKSTLVAKALEALVATHRTVRVGRMSLRCSDVLEHLLEELGETDLPHGPIRRSALLREKLAQQESTGTRVVVVIEDALRLGAESLAELEALTAADAGESNGAALVVMGDARLGQLLPDPQLTRLAQRLQHCHQVRPMSDPELRGYLRHSLRQAGADFDTVFAPDVATTLRDLSQGITRVANKIVEAALSAAAASRTRPLSAAFVADVAGREFGLKTKTVAVPEPVPEPTSSSTAEPVIVFAEETSDGLDSDDPGLIRHTLTDLELPTPEATGAETEPAATEQPEAAAGESPASEVPDWEKDPTLAELMPDLDALEKAMAIARGDGDDPADADSVDVPVLQPEPVQQAEQGEVIPEITLDDAIQQRIDDNLIDEPGSVSASQEEAAAGTASDGDLPDVKLPPRNAKKADAELERIATELAKAKRIEDVDDRLAETLFGEELSLAAAEVAALVKAEQSSNDADLSVFQTNTAPVARAVGSPVVDGIEIALESSPCNSGLDPSASQRLNTVRSLMSADVEPAPVPVGAPAEKASQPAVEESTPDPIEDQIITSMTQTLKALDVKPPVLDRTSRIGDDQLDDDDDDAFYEDQEKKGGFFSRFRRP
jgi:type II secretory pathway predicted ATPase ExeA